MSAALEKEAINLQIKRGKAPAALVHLAFEDAGQTVSLVGEDGTIPRIGRRRCRYLAVQTTGLPFAE
jgi:hypothetical protein